MKGSIEMNRNEARRKILEFGEAERRNFVEKDNLFEMHRIDMVRARLLFCISHGTIKEVRELLERMTNYTSVNGKLQCDTGCFVYDDFTRNLLITFKNNF